MQDRWGRGIAALAAFQAGDAIASAKLDYIQRDLDRIDCPPRIRRLLPFIKAASAVGLVLGRRWPRLGRLTSAALSAYFVCAVGFHVRAKDPLWRSLPAASLLAVSLAVAVRGYEDDQPTSPNPVSRVDADVVPSAHVEVDLSEQHQQPAGITA